MVGAVNRVGILGVARAVWVVGEEGVGVIVEVPDTDQQVAPHQGRMHSTRRSLPPQLTSRFD